MTEDKTHIVKFDVVLTNSGVNKIQLMSIVMDLTGGGLKKSKDLIDQPPGVILQSVSKKDADAAIQRLEAAGAKAEMRRVLK
jgi:large subunit ribosomal protein L7/L12